MLVNQAFASNVQWALMVQMDANASLVHSELGHRTQVEEVAARHLATRRQVYREFIFLLESRRSWSSCGVGVVRVIKALSQLTCPTQVVVVDFRSAI